MADHNKPPKKGDTIQATPYPSRHHPPESSDDTRLRAPTSFPDLLEVPPELPLSRVDAQSYDVGDEVARGGLGRILKAHDRRLNRPVAIKVLRVRDRDAEIRFMREALITARLQHPAIVPIYEAGRWPDGEPFYAMKLLAGKSLSDLVADRPGLADRLALLPNCIAVADAMAYAHEHRVIHRDLKPANVMVGEYGETVVIDWGLAKDLDGDPDDPMPGKSIDKTPVVFATETVAGAVLGTPAYMPPEQAAGLRVDERADVYALGAMLYHVLRGSSPIDEMSPAEAMRRVMAGPLPDIGTLVPGVPADLAAIVRKAMAHQRSHRYPSAKELAADLRRFQTGQLVSVRTYFWWERLWRWTSRHRAVMAVATAAALALVVIGTLSVRRVIEERNTAQKERRQADAARSEADRRTNDLVLVQALTALDRDPTAALAWLKQHPGTDVLARLRTAASDAVSRGVARHVLRAHAGKVTGVAFGASSSELVSIGADGRMRAYDLRTGAASPLVEPPGVLWILARAPDGRTFAVAGNGNHVRLVSPGAAERALEHDGSAVLALEFSPDGRRLAAGSVTGKVWLWDVETSQRRQLEAHSAEVRDLAFAPGGARLASTGWDGLVKLHTLDTGVTKTIRASKDEIYSMDFSPDGRLLATGHVDGNVKVWDPAGALVAQLEGHRGQVTHLVFSPDGSRLATAGRDHDVRLWSVPFKESRALEGHVADVARVEFSPDGRTLASASLDATVRVWDVATGSVRVLQGHESQVTVMAFSTDGRMLATAGQDGSVRAWSTEVPGAQLGPQLSAATLSASGLSLAGVAKSDGNLLVLDRAAVTHALTGSDFRFFGFVNEDRVVALDGKRDVVVWTPSTGRRATLGRLPVDVGSAVEASGWIAVGAYDGTVHLWRPADGVERVWRAHATYTLGLAASADGRTIATSGEEGLVKLWDVATGASRELVGHVGPVHPLRFSGDGALVASGDMTGEARVWRVATGELVVAEKHRGFVRTVAFSRDGALLASGGDDKTIHVRRLVGSAPAVVLTGPEQPVFDLAFSPDGELLAMGSADHTVRVYEWKSGAGRVLRGHGATVSRVQFVADGSVLVSVDASGGVRRWTREEVAPLPGSRHGLAQWIDAATAVRIDGEHRPATPR